MASADIFDSYLSGFSGVGETIYIVFFVALVGLLIGGVMVFLMYWTAFKHTVVFRVVTKQGKYIKTLHARTRTIKGVRYWQMRSLKKVLVSAPPPESIHMTKKGQMFAEANITEDNPEPVWLIDTGKEYGAVEPFSTQERALHVQMLEDSERRKKKSLGDLIMQILPYGLVIIIIFGILVFYDNVAQPNIELANRAAAAVSTLERITVMQEKITKDQARIMGTQGVVITQEIPPDAELSGGAS